MGCRFFGSRRTGPEEKIVYIKENGQPKKTKPNPNPWNFKILKTEQFKNAHVLLIQYPDCTTFEGTKLLVIKGEIKPVDYVDPHFSDKDGDYAPVARFQPTKQGWLWATEFAKKL